MRARAYLEANTCAQRSGPENHTCTHAQVCPDAEEVGYLNQLSDRGGKGGKKDAATEEWRRATRKHVLDLRIRHEQEHSKIFEMIYPTEDPAAQEAYSRCHDASLAVFRAMFGGVAKPQLAEKSWEQCLRSSSSAFTRPQSSVATMTPVKRSLDTERAGTIWNVDHLRVHAW